MDNLNNSEVFQNIKRIMKGCIISIIITLVFLLIFSVILTYTSVSENIQKPVIIVISTISVLIGASISSLKLKKRGIINGGIIGFLYIISIYFLSSITLTGFNLNIYSIIMILFNIFAGMIGGIIGVNL